MGVTITKLRPFAAAVLLVLCTSSQSFAAEEEKPKNEPLPLEQLRTFANIFGRIKEDYVESVDDTKLLEYAIRGMLAGLDPHSAYLDTTDFQELQEGTRGEFGGLGIEVGMEDGFVKVIAPIDDTPAQRAGVQAGDLIIRLNEQQVKGMNLNDAVQLMRGDPGTEITLTIVRNQSDKPIKITIVRDVIKVASVKGRILEPGFGYLRISHFQSRTTDDMLAKISELKQKAGGELKGMVMDLRNNPGGVLGAAVAVSDAFLTEGKIVYTKGRVADSAFEYKAAPDDVLDGAPIVVLVNEGSASASEIVAGALQDHKRALILGTRTFGKGSVQTIIPIGQETAIKLTTARYYTPSGRSIQAEGIVPDIELPPMKVTDVGGAQEALKEADLAGHLDQGKPDAPSKGSKETEDKSEAEGAKDEQPLVERDFQLNEALNLLKGLSILHQKQG